MTVRQLSREALIANIAVWAQSDAGKVAIAEALRLAGVACDELTAARRVDRAMLDVPIGESEAGNLVECPKCGEAYPAKLESCPNCGERNPSERAARIIPQTVYDGLAEVIALACRVAFNDGAKAMREAAADWLEADGTLRPAGIAIIRTLPLPKPTPSR